ncbi:hypothetical protein BDW66DRAFT_146588 [Aspergillus desertorum]
MWEEEPVLPEQNTKRVSGRIWFVSAVILNAPFQLNYTYSCYECNTAKKFA